MFDDSIQLGPFCAMSLIGFLNKPYSYFLRLVTCLHVHGGMLIHQVFFTCCHRRSAVWSLNWKWQEARRYESSSHGSLEEILQHPPTNRREREREHRCKSMDNDVLTLTRWEIHQTWWRNEIIRRHGRCGCEEGVVVVLFCSLKRGTCGSRHHSQPLASQLPLSLSQERES